MGIAGWYGDRPSFPPPPCLAGHLGRSRWTDRLRPLILLGGFGLQPAQMRTAIASQLAAPPPGQPQTLNVNVCNASGQVNTCMYPR